MLDLTFERLLPPLECHFINCDPIWVTETRRLFTMGTTSATTTTMAGAEVRWMTQTCQLDPVNHSPATRRSDPHNHLDRIPRHSFAAIQLDVASLEAWLPLIHDLVQREIAIAVVGPAAIRRRSTAILALGVITVVTDIFRCDRLTSIIRKAAIAKPEVITGWRTRFINRLPWEPVSNSA